MQQMLPLIAMGLFLWICTVEDVKSQKVSLWICFSFGIFGSIFRISEVILNEKPESIYPYLAGMGFAIVVIILGKLSGEQIGYGDGMVLLVLAFYRDWKFLIGSFMVAVFLSSLYGMIIFVLSGRKRGLRFPFIPFLFVGYVGNMLEWM